MIKTIKRKPLLKARPEEKNTPKKEKTSKSLPADAYKDEIDPIDLEIDDSRKLVISVKRGGELGLPMCDIRQYQTTDLYTGFTKKGINIPVELVAELIEVLQVAYNDSEEKGLI